MSIAEYETRELWLYSHGSADAKPFTAINVNGEWHYVTDTGIHPLYSEITPKMLSRRACLEAQLEEERKHLSRTQERCRQIEAKLQKLRFDG